VIPEQNILDKINAECPDIIVNLKQGMVQFQENNIVRLEKDITYKDVVTYLHTRLKEMENRVKNLTNFGDWSISKQLFEIVTKILPKGSTILELGSGQATQEFSHYGYEMYSIEHDEHWLKRYYTNYIYVPLAENGWYNPIYLKNLPKYDLLIIDGPESEKRDLMIDYLDLFDLSKPIVLDNADYCLKLVFELSKIKEKKAQLLMSGVALSAYYE
jgi:hypothetical protein